MNQDLKRTLWAAADKLRSSMDAAEYKHIVLGLIFLKYISDAFDERRAALSQAFSDPKSDLHLPDTADHAGAMEERDYYTMANVFWVPAPARWESIRAQAKQADIGVRIDAALEAIEAINPSLKGILDKRFGRTQFEPGRLGELIDLISTIGFGEGHHAKDLLGEVYEYFLGQFATAEGNETAQVIEELIAMARKFQEAAQRGERLGLNNDELSFYDALATNESSVRELGDETLRKIAVELARSLRGSVAVDWAKRETVRARLRVMVRTLLRRYKYPPDRQEEATETVLKQAETLSETWATAA